MKLSNDILYKLSRYSLEIASALNIPTPYQNIEMEYAVAHRSEEMCKYLIRLGCQIPIIMACISSCDFLFELPEFILISKDQFQVAIEANVPNQIILRDFQCLTNIHKMDELFLLAIEHDESLSLGMLKILSPLSNWRTWRSAWWSEEVCGPIVKFNRKALFEKFHHRYEPHNWYYKIGIYRRWTWLPIIESYCTRQQQYNLCMEDYEYARFEIARGLKLEPEDYAEFIHNDARELVPVDAMVDWVVVMQSTDHDPEYYDALFEWADKGNHPYTKETLLPYFDFLSEALKTKINRLKYFYYVNGMNNLRLIRIKLYPNASSHKIIRWVTIKKNDAFNILSYELCLELPAFQRWSQIGYTISATIVADAVGRVLVICDAQSSEIDFFVEHFALELGILEIFDCVATQPERVFPLR